MNPNPTRVSSAASGAFTSVGVTTRSDSRKSAGPEQASKGDFQRFLDQAAQKKVAEKSVAEKSVAEKSIVENRAAEKQTAANLTSEKQAAANRQETRHAGAQQAKQRLQNQQLEKKQFQDEQLQDKQFQDKQFQESQLNEKQPMENTAGPRNPTAQPADGGGRATEKRVTELPEAGRSENPVAGGFAEPESPDRHAFNLALPDGSLTDTAETGLASADIGWSGFDLHDQDSVTVSLEEIAQAVAEFTGVAAAYGDGAATGRERALIASGAPVAGFFKPSPGTYYANYTVPASGPAAAATTASGADVALTPGLAFAEISRQLAGAARGAQAAEQSGAGGLSADIDQDSARGAFREALPGSLLTPLGQPADGNPAPLTQGTAQFNLPGGLRGGLGQPEWHNAIAERIAVMASKNLTSAEIQLDPPELGQLLVRVTLNQEQVSVNFASQNAAVREALDQTAYRLREMFDAEGLNLVNVDVSDQSFQRQQQQESSAVHAGEGEALDEAVAEPVVVKLGQGLIDQFV